MIYWSRQKERKRKEERRERRRERTKNFEMWIQIESYTSRQSDRSKEKKIKVRTMQCLEDFKPGRRSLMASRCADRLSYLNGTFMEMEEEEERRL